jgi:hypothetical protein
LCSAAQLAFLTLNFLYAPESDAVKFLPDPASCGGSLNKTLY